MSSQLLSVVRAMLLHVCQLFIALQIGFKYLISSINLCPFCANESTLYHSSVSCQLWEAPMCVNADFDCLFEVASWYSGIPIPLLRVGSQFPNHPLCTCVGLGRHKV